MVVTTQIKDWQKTNLDYLMRALTPIHQALTNYINLQSTEVVKENNSSHNSYINPEYRLERLCNIFGLSDFERSMLLLCAGMELDRSWSDLCAVVMDKENRDYPTFGLAHKVLDNFDWNGVTVDSPLRKWSLLEVGVARALMDAPLRIDEQIFHYILGNHCFNEKLIGIVKEQQTHDIPILVDSHQKIVLEIVTNWKQPSNRSQGIQLYGNEIASKRAIAQAVATNLQLKLYVLSANNIPSNPLELDRFLTMWERETLLGESILLLDCDDINIGDPNREHILKSSIESINSPLLISSTDRISTKQRSIITFEVYKPTSQEQHTIWENILSDQSTEATAAIDDLVSHFNLTAPEIKSAYTRALNADKIAREQKLLINEELTDNDKLTKNQESEAQGEKDPLYPSFSLLWNSCRTQAQPKLDELGQRMTLKATWKDLVLNESQLQTLESIAAHIDQRIKVYQKWGFAGKGGRGLGISALFSGTSGTGKTMSAEVLANALNLDLYRIDLSTTVSKYIGETEKNLRRIFDAAEGAGAILLFDEADALFGKRSDVKDARDRYANMEVSYLLQRMEEYQGLAILTTNLRGSIDRAFLRRIRFIIEYRFPDASQRRKIWRRVFPKNTPTKDLDYIKLSRLNVAGGNIRNIALNAAFIAADLGEPVMMKHIKIATKSEYTKIDRTLTDSEIAGWV